MNGILFYPQMCPSLAVSLSYWHSSLLYPKCIDFEIIFLVHVHVSNTYPVVSEFFCVRYNSDSDTSNNYLCFLVRTGPLLLDQRP